jgi:hypothetical protein
MLKGVPCLFIVLFFLFPEENFAQNTSIGFRVGPTLYKIKELERRAGFNLGGFYTKSISENFGITTELSYNRNRTEELRPGNDVIIRLYHANASVLPTIFFRNDELPKILVPKIFAGPQLSVLTKTSGKPEYVTNEKPVLDKFSKTDLSLVAGAGVYLRIAARKWLYMDTRYSFGLLDMNKSRSGVQNSTALTFNIGLSFPFGKF